MRFIGIDPGASGGIAVLNAAGSVETVVQPSSEAETCEWLLSVTETPCRIAVELVGGYVAGNETPGSAMFNFGRGVGVIIGCLLTIGTPFEEVTPQRWQAAVGVRRARDCKKRQWKVQLKEVAQRLWPDYRVTLWAADALLIARYALLSGVEASAGISPFED